MAEINICNQCKYYEGVHDVQGHAPCSFNNIGGVLWNYCCPHFYPYRIIDREKVVKGLECIISSGNAGMRDDCTNCVYPGGGDCVAPALRDALALLKAQESVKPNAIMHEKMIMYYQCPSCLATIDPSDNFCQRCGKAVKWE